MKQFKKLSLVLLSVFILAACGQKSNNDSGSTEVVTEIPNGTTVTFWHAMNRAQEDALETLAQEFMKENPNIKIDLQNQSSYKELPQKLNATYVSPKDLPTMTQAYPGWVENAIRDGLVESLDEYINHQEIGIEDYEDVFEFYRETVKYDGKTMALPFNKSSEVLYYNKDILDEAGVEVPTTMEELKEVSKTIYEKTGISGLGFDSLDNYYITGLYNKGIKFEEGLDVKSQESQDVINYYREGVEEGYFRIAGDDGYLSIPFGNQQVAMNIGSTAGLSYIIQGSEDADFEYGVAVSPVETNISQGTDVYIFSSATPEEKTAAFKFLTFLLSKDSQIYWANETGYLPARVSAMKADEYKKSGNKISAIAEEMTESLYTRVPTASVDSAAQAAKASLEKILLNPKDDIMPALDELELNLNNTWTE